MTTKKVSIADALRRVKRRIQKGWCKNWLGMTASGRSTYATDPKATRWCLIGAALREGVLDVVDSPLTAALPQDEYMFGRLAGFNNAQRSRKPVIALIDRAIANLKPPKRREAQGRES